MQEKALGCVKMLIQKHLRKKTVFVLIFIGLCLLILYTVSSKSSLETGIKWEKIPHGPEEKLCLQFLQKSMSSNKGIFTKFLDNKQIKEWATGHQVLSESEGLIMLYAVQAGDKPLFEKHFDIIKNMILDDGVIMWRVGKQGELLTKTSASIDDLRVIRSLVFAYERWKDKKYEKMLKELIYKTKKYQLTPQGLIDYYDSNTETRAKTINLSYIDLYTMNLLVQIDDDWEKAAEKGLEIIKDGLISEERPLFRKYYDYETKSYSVDDEINIIDYLKVLLHLSEVGMCPNEAIDWLKEQIKTHKALFNSYYTDSAEPASGLQSSAAYAIACRIATNIGDYELYESMKDKLLMFQITEESNLLYGAFGEYITKEIYSFDNLQALLALQNFGGLKK